MVDRLTYFSLVGHAWRYLDTGTVLEPDLDSGV
uniref:Uncharacterized protein n=1 Tax=Arundo donax TaxID=35708 RepID=A0A0A8Z5Y3_ARUDO